jgi:homoserine kinase
VVPALLGGCRLAATKESNEWEICDVPWHKGVVPVVAIPDFELSTKKARRVLPEQVSRADAIFNTAHLGLLLRGLETGQGNWIKAALQDRLHQPYRQALIQGYEAVRAAAMATDALGMVISGAGPTLLALAATARAATVAAAMEKAWQQEGIAAQVRSLAIDTQGAIQSANSD